MRCPNMVSWPKSSCEKHIETLGMFAAFSGMKDYPLIQLYTEAIIRIPINQPVCHGSCHLRIFITAQLAIMTC